MAEIFDFPPRGPKGEELLKLPRRERFFRALRMALDDVDLGGGVDPDRYLIAGDERHVLKLAVRLYEATSRDSAAVADLLEEMARDLRAKPLSADEDAERDPPPEPGAA